MSDATDTTPAPASDQDEVDDPLVSRLEDLWVMFGKALRAVQLYEENNPVYQRFVSGLREAFRELWSEVSRLRVAVDEARLVVSSIEVYKNANRSDSIAFLMFKDGIREVTFLEGFEEEEMEILLNILHRARHQGSEGDDLLTMLWEADLQFFEHQFVDLLAEGVGMPEPGEGASRETLERALTEEAAEAEAEVGAGAEDEPPPSQVDRESFNPTLYALDPREMQQLERDLDLEMKRDLRADVLAALLDRLEEPERPERQSEIVGILRTLIPGFLARGALDPAAMVLEELHEIVESGVLDRERRAEVDALLDDVSAPSAIAELVRALEDGAIAPAPQPLGAFLEHLRPQALGPLLRASETVVVKELTPVLQEAVKSIAMRNQDVLIQFLSDQDIDVIVGAANLVGRLQVESAADGLIDALRHPVPRVRMAAVEAAQAIRASTAAGPLVDALEDPERTVRIAAARALGELRYRPAAAAFRGHITGRALRSADISEKVAFFEAYGQLGDEDAVPLLDKLLNGKSLLGRREPDEIRACAALALGKVGTPDAREALARASAEDEPVVRSAVNRALRSGTDAELEG